MARLGRLSRMTRVGFGYDSHRFAPGRALMLGGVSIPHEFGLAGHSDADAVLHAVIDALLGAAGLGDIGEQFPDTDAAHADADSAQLLARTVEMLRQRGLRPAGADVTILAEAPKLSPHKPAMKARIAFLLGVPEDRVAVKAKTNEGMAFVGRGEGIAAMAVAVVEDTPQAR